MDETLERIRKILSERFEPLHLDLVDDSASHAGHAGARAGGGHFIVTLASHRFEGLTLIEQHRMVNAALRAMIGREIHALGLHTFTPGRWRESHGAD